jgi:hypothetical protein
VSKSSELLHWMQSHYVAVTCAHKAQLPTNEANSPACAVGQTDVHGGKKTGRSKLTAQHIAAFNTARGVGPLLWVLRSTSTFDSEATCHTTDATPTGLG